MSRMSPATPNNRALARFVRVSSPPRSVVAANVIGKIVTHTFKSLARLFARPIKHMTHTLHDSVVTTLALVLDSSLAVIFHNGVHRRTRKHSFGPRHRSLVRTDV